jgi:putative ABC transport system permease protein
VRAPCEPAALASPLGRYPLYQGKLDIVSLLRDRYRVRAQQDNPFSVQTTEEFARKKARISTIFRNVLVAIASISLLVGGIGIMNMMLVSVSERSREIGLRMALGARKKDIRLQFLVEAAMLSAFGGEVGLLLAFSVPAILDAAAGFPAHISLVTALGTLAFSAGIGITFGALPAFRASDLSPMEALRRE